MKQKRFKRSLPVILVMMASLVACNDAASSAQTAPKQKAALKTTAKPAAVKISGVKFGKYGCTASKYRNGSVEYQPRGFVSLEPTGNYTYSGFKQPSKGSYTVDAQGNLHFTGGYLDAGEGTKIDRPNKYFLVFPANPDNRWTCGWVE